MFLMLVRDTQLKFTCQKSTTETLEKGVFIVNFEHISHLFQVTFFTFFLGKIKWLLCCSYNPHKTKY